MFATLRVSFFFCESPYEPSEIISTYLPTYGGIHGVMKPVLAAMVLYNVVQPLVEENLFCLGNLCNELVEEVVQREAQPQCAMCSGSSTNRRIG